MLPDIHKFARWHRYLTNNNWFQLLSSLYMMFSCVKNVCIVFLFACPFRTRDDVTFDWWHDWPLIGRSLWFVPPSAFTDWTTDSAPNRVTGRSCSSLAFCLRTRIGMIEFETGNLETFFLLLFEDIKCSTMNGCTDTFIIIFLKINVLSCSLICHLLASFRSTLARWSES